MLFIVLSLSTVAFSQSKKNRNYSARMDVHHPTVYITVERSEKVDLSKQISDRIWFKFHNNTRWGIRLDASGEEKVFGKTKLFYDIMSDYEKVEKSIRCHVCSIMILKPGKSVSFSIPKEYFSKAYAVRISFNYEWESETNVDNSREPVHFVYFYSRNLPREAIP